LSQTKTSFLTRKKCYGSDALLPSVVLWADAGIWKPAGPGKRFGLKRKKLASAIPVSTMRLEFEEFSLFIMNLLIAVKRVLFVGLTVSGLALYAIAADPKGPCPLPVSNETSENAQSPEKPACTRRVLHNGMTVCLPCPAADAHVRVHGDADMGACDKPGNETPGK
jgi:hypothetical protein